MRNKILGFFILLCAGLYLNSQEYQELSINAQVVSRCKLELSSNSMSFSRAGSYTSSLIVQNEPPLEVTVKTTTKPGQKVHLRILATADLVDYSTGNTISPKSISWQATGSGFNAGSLQRGISVTIGEWNKSGVWKGTLTFSFQDREEYAPGIYTLVVSMSTSSF